MADSDQNQKIPIGTYQSEVQDENLLLIVVFDFLDAQKTPEEKVATN